MPTTYEIQNSRGDVIASIEAGTTDTTSTSLVLHGKGQLEYGLDRNQNLVYLLENFANTSAPANPILGQLWWNTQDSQMYIWEDAWRTLVPPAQDVGFNIIAGDGLQGGGVPTDSPISVRFGIGEGVAIISNANNLEVDATAVDHDLLLNFESSRHVDHTAVTLIAGNGVTGGGDLTASRTINVGAGSGITVSTNSIAVDSTVIRTSGSTQTITSGVLTFTNVLFSADGTAANPAYTFINDTTTGMYRSGNDALSFATGGSRRITIESNGVMSVGTANYETLVTEDDDIPNKKYVDSLLGTGVPVTSNTFVGTTSLTGLDGAQTYLVSAYGILPDKGASGSAEDIQAVRVRAGTTLGSGTILAQTGSATVDWCDGECPSFVQMVVPMGGNTSLHVQFNDAASDLPRVTSDRYSTYVIAVQLTNN